MFVSARLRAGGAGLMRVALDAAAEALPKGVGKLYPLAVGLESANGRVAFP